MATAARLLEEADQLSRARLLASTSRESRLWLHALHVPTLGTLLVAESFRVAIALRVGADVCEPHVCQCGQRMDSRRLHGLSCCYSAGRHLIHTILNDFIWGALNCLTSVLCLSQWGLIGVMVFKSSLLLMGSVSVGLQHV